MFHINTKGRVVACPIHLTMSDTEDHIVENDDESFAVNSQNEKIELMIEVTKNIQNTFKEQQTGLRKKLEEDTENGDGQFTLQLSNLYNTLNTMKSHPLNKHLILEKSEDGTRGRYVYIKDTEPSFTAPVSLDSPDTLTKKQIFSGLTRPLAKTFFTSCNRDAKDDSEEWCALEADDLSYVTRDEYEDIIMDELTDEEKKRAEVKSLCKHTDNPMKHGTVVHEELETMIQLLNDSDSPHGMLDFFRSVSGDQDRPEHPDICTLQVLYSLAEHNMFPVCAELLTYDKDIRLATQVDLVCFNTNDLKIVFMELKTHNCGTEQFINANNAKPMINCPITLYDTPANRAAMQLLISAMIWQKNYNICPDRLLVVHVHKPRGSHPVVKYHTLEEALIGKPDAESRQRALEVRNHIYKSLCDTRTSDMARNKLARKRRIAWNKRRGGRNR